MCVCVCGKDRERVIVCACVSDCVCVCMCDCVHMCVFFFCVMERQNHFSDFYAKDMSVIF